MAKQRPCLALQLLGPTDRLAPPPSPLQLSAPEGRALWTYTAPEDQAVDVGVCKAAALNETGTALTVYDLSSVGPVT